MFSLEGKAREAGQTDRKGGMSVGPLASRLTSPHSCHPLCSPCLFPINSYPPVLVAISLSSHCWKLGAILMLKNSMFDLFLKAQVTQHPPLCMNAKMLTSASPEYLDDSILTLGLRAEFCLPQCSVPAWGSPSIPLSTVSALPFYPNEKVVSNTRKRKTGEKS